MARARIAAIVLSAAAIFPAACNPGVPMDSLEWTTTTPRNADIRGKYEARVSGGDVHLPPDGVRVEMSLLRDGTFTVGSTAPFDVPENVAEYADVLRPAKGAWSAVQDSSGYWRIELQPASPPERTISFHLTGRAPPYGFYGYFDDPDLGHVVSWKRVAGDEAAGPKSLPEAPEPTATYVEGEPPFPSVVEPILVVALVAVLVLMGLVTIAAIVYLLLFVAIVGAVIVVGATAAAALLASVVALVKRSLGAGARTFGGTFGAVGGLAAGAGAGWAIDVLLRRPITESLAAACGAVVGAAGGAVLGWGTAYLGVRLLETAIRRLRLRGGASVSR